jgi:hypothetical protein
MDAEKILKQVGMDEVVMQRMRLQGYLLKTLLPEIARRPQTIARDKIIHVIDMQGASMRLLSSTNSAVFKRLQEVDANFPEFLYKTYLVNCPMGVRAIWATFSAMVPARVRAKVRIYGPLTGSRMKKFASLFGGEEKVPDFLGGKCKRKLEQCPPWNLASMSDPAFKSWEEGVVLSSPSLKSPSMRSSLLSPSLSAKGSRSVSKTDKSPARSSTMKRLFTRKEK